MKKGRGRGNLLLSRAQVHQMDQSEYSTHLANRGACTKVPIAIQVIIQYISYTVYILTREYYRYWASSKSYNSQCVF